MLLSDFRMLTKDLPDDYVIRLEGLIIESAPFGPIITKDISAEDFDIDSISINPLNTSVIIENQTWTLDMSK